jgi:hypothetical protein
MPIILDTWEAGIRRIAFEANPKLIVHKTLSQKNPITKKGWWSACLVNPSNPHPSQKKKEVVEARLWRRHNRGSEYMGFIFIFSWYWGLNSWPHTS